jgi:WD40 repeat protein
VSKLCFSPSGELLLTIGNNDLNSTIGVYKWRERRLVFAAKMPGLGFYDCSFLCSDNSFGICGKELVHFWTKSKSQEPYRHYRGAANLFPSQDHMTSIACVESAIVTGSTSGALWLWEGRVCVKRVVVFHFPVKKLFACSVGLFVSTEEGAIHLLDNDLDLQRRLDPPRRSNCDTIQSLCWESSRGKLLVGDSSNSLSEMDLNGNTKNIMSSHSTLTDFTVDNLNDNIITVGKDGFVRVWDKGVRVILQQHNLERSLSCIACTRGDKQSDKMVAVGFCRDDVCSSDKTDVAFVILRGNDLTNISHQGRNSQKTLTVCRFSNDGKLVAFGSKDCSIYVHSTDKDFSLIAKARGHSAPILTLDFGCADDLSDSATFLRSNSITGEALFWSTHAKKQTPLSQRHTRWESYSCIYGWYLEGAHGMYTEESGATITSCCPLSENSIVIGDSSGRLRVLSNPALSKESIYLQYTCHHGRIQKIALFRESLYTFGGDDSCLLKWKVSGLSWPPTMPPSLYDDYVITEEKIESQHPTVSLELATAQMEDLDFNIKHKSSNLSAKPHRPWMRSIVPPSNYTPQLGQLPGCSLVLERIHGYNGNSAQNNLQYISRGASIVYSVGKTLIRYDDEGDMQRFCHVAGKIRSLAIQQERSLCAVGQDDDEQGIVIVDLKTMNYMSLYKSAAKGIHCLDFDESGRYLLALGGNRLTIYDVDNGRKIASTLTHAAESLDAKFAARKSDKLVEVGRNFVRLWFIKGSDMRFEEAEMSSVENVCCCFVSVVAILFVFISHTNAALFFSQQHSTHALDGSAVISS